jgi:hypothetical protein
MTIKYPNGTIIEAVILTRDETSIRAAVQGADDVVQLANVRGAWVTEDLEPVQIQFEWQRRGRKPGVSEADCICPQELAAKLLDLLTKDSGDHERKPKPDCETPLYAVAGRTVV